jgi:hypothetical protein
MIGRRLLVAGLILLSLAGGTAVALLASRGGGEEQSAGISQRRSTSTTSPAEPESGSTPVRFVLSDRYKAGEKINVAIENIGTRAYVYQAYYQACFLSYFDSSGRRFIIPPGTHCDLLAKETIRPGERKKLFSWKLDECVKDNWGCVESRPLAPGRYTVKGIFKPKLAGPGVRVETTFTIVAT